MAHPGPSGHRSRHSRNISAVISGPALMDAAPQIVMVPNPDFAFPRRPSLGLPSTAPTNTSTIGQRPVSMHDQRPRTVGLSHRKTASTLPSFSFNAADTSGLQADRTPPQTPDESPLTDYADLRTGAALATPSRHRRNNSEFIGGDSRLGVGGAISSSPTKTLLPETSNRPFSHKHRRSVALSSHDLSSIMGPTEHKPRLSNSLPATPLEPLPIRSNDNHPDSATVTENDMADPFGSATEDASDRPPSRPRVGFADSVEYIPRPLSTISSETESSISTLRGHSVNNSISSLLSLGTPSPPSYRARASTLGTTSEGPEPRSATRPSNEVGKRIEREGDWLRTMTSRSLSDYPPTDTVAQKPNVAFIPDRDLTNARDVGTPALDVNAERRKSETAFAILSAGLTPHSQRSLLGETSLPRPLSEHSGSFFLESKLSKQNKIKDWKGWAKSKIGKKSRESAHGVEDPVSTSTSASASASSIEPVSDEPSSEDSVSGLTQPESVPIAETDLDAVFSSQAPPSRTQNSYADIEFRVSNPGLQATPQARDPDEYNYMLDLDAALGPFKTPHSLSPNLQHRPIRELHSSRLTKDFTGPGGHYYPEPVHRRTKSTPTGKLDQALYIPPHERMQDVFEEEEEEEEDEADSTKDVRLSVALCAQDEESGIGVRIVDSEPVAATGSPLNLGIDTNVHNSQGSWELERPTTSYGLVSSRLSTPIMERRASSLIEETIIEETSPVEPIEIVHAYEEPRASSLTKSSDSSDTPTVLAAQPALLTLADGTQSVSTSETCHTSTFSSPDFGRRQGSFDNSRAGTSASSIADSRTMSSYTTGEPTLDVRMSVDDVPSLTSSRSTMLSTFQINTSRRDISGTHTPPVQSGPLDVASASEERRRKRSSIQSLSQLMGGSFGTRIPASDEERPHTANEAASAKGLRKKDNRLKKLMFWKSKHRQVSSSTTMTT